MDDMLFYGYPFLLLIMMALSALGGGPQCSLALTYVSFVALALALSAHIVWRRLHWVPVEGELVGVYKYPGTRPVACVRYEFCGRVYESQDSIPLGLGRHGTVWVDPAYPSRILPPSWKFRLLFYLAYGAGLIDLLLRL